MFNQYIKKGEWSFSIIKDATLIKTIAYGKSVLFLFEKEGKKQILVSQLGMTGSWFLNDVCKERGHFHLILEFDDIKIKYSDPRMFGKMKIYSGSDFEEIKKQIIKDYKWGIDPLKSDIDEIYDQIIKLKKSGKDIKSKLLEQNLIFGIGNYLASEILFDTLITPTRKCNEISFDEYKTLASSIKKICGLALANKGFSFAGGYIMPDGSMGGLSTFIKVYQKESEKCPICSKKIKKSFINGRATYFCSNCQK